MITNYEYDTLGRLIKVIDALSGETQFTYDSYGNKLTQTDAEGRVTAWTYDALGRVASRTLPMGQTETMRYNEVGNMVEHVDFKGQTTMHIYDVNDRLTESVYADLTETFAYDALGNRTESTKTENGISSTWQYSYDNLNRLSSETQFAGTPEEVTLAYQYDAAGNRAEVTETKGALTRITRYTYDALNRLKTVQDADGNTTTYSYDAVGNRSAMTHANGTLVGYVYDDLNRLTDLSHQNSGGVTLKSYSYSLLPNGKRSKIIEANGRTSDYQYDDLYRLTSEAIFDPVNSSHNASYTYDKVGNRTFEEVNGVSTAYTYNDNDWLLQTGGTTYTHDANGNTETQTLDGVVTMYSYNAKNELIASDEAGLATAYLYNVDGVRVGMGDASGQTRYTIDSNRAYAQVIAEHVDGTETVSYVYGDDLISQKRGTETSTYHYDGLGSTRALSDSSGVLTDEYDYDAFGEVLNQTGTTENDYLFTGEQFDATLDQYYLRARYYDQSIGRFTQMDTWMGNNSDPVTLHKYLYANVDPVNNIDPSGNFGIGSFGAASSIQGSLASLTVTTGHLVRAYNTVQAVSGFFDFVNAVKTVMGQLTSFTPGDAARSGIPGGVDMQAAIESASYNLPKAIGTGMGNWGKGYSTSKRKGKKLKSFLVYMPLLRTGASGSIAIKTPAKVRFGNRKIPVKLVFGGPRGASGTIMGLGMEMGKKRQLIRMDYHRFNPNHGGVSGIKPNELSVWKDGNFHYHVNKW